MPQPLILPYLHHDGTPRGFAPLLLSRTMSGESVPTFRASARPRAGAVVIVAEGELDLVGAPRLLEALPVGGDEPVVLDLGAVGFMDSSGLRALLDLRRACTEAGRTLTLARPSPPVLRVLELVDLSGEFSISERAPG